MTDLTVTREERRIENIISHAERLAALAEDLGRRIENVLDRAVGVRPPVGENASTIQPSPDGYFQQLESALRRIEKAQDAIGSDLQELERVL